MNTYMCSTNCPCDSSVVAGWGNFTETQLNEFGRTAVQYIAPFYHGNNCDYNSWNY
jgi:hypothetical protein